MKGLRDKAAIVTGGASGIGRACVERLCEEGCSVTFSGVSDIGNSTARELTDKGGKVQFLRGDMGEESFCKDLVAAAVSAWGRLDYLVNNAFSFTTKGLDATRADWNRVMNVGPVAYATMGQAVFLHMKKRGAGAIVNLSSISAHIAQPGRWTYNAAKGPRQRRQSRLDLDAGSGQGRRRRPREVGAGLGQVPHAAPTGYG